MIGKGTHHPAFVLIYHVCSKHFRNQFPLAIALASEDKSALSLAEMFADRRHKVPELIQRIAMDDFDASIVSVGSANDPVMW